MHLGARAINHCLNKRNYKYLQLREEILLTSSDKKKGLRFARVLKNYLKTFGKMCLSIQMESVLYTGPIHRTMSW